MRNLARGETLSLRSCAPGFRKFSLKSYPISLPGVPAIFRCPSRAGDSTRRESENAIYSRTRTNCQINPANLSYRYLSTAFAFASRPRVDLVITNLRGEFTKLTNLLARTFFTVN